MRRIVNILKSLASKEQREKLPVQGGIAIYLVIGLTLGILTPENVLDYSWARTYTDFMASWLPCVAEVGRWTKVASTQFISAILNSLAMMWMLWYSYVRLMLCLEAEIKWQSEWTTKDKFLHGFLFTPGLIACAWFVVVSTHAPNRDDFRMITSNFGMGTYGSIITLGGWLSLAFALVTIIAFLVRMYRHFVRLKG